MIFISAFCGFWDSRVEGGYCAMLAVFCSYLWVVEFQTPYMDS